MGNEGTKKKMEPTMMRNQMGKDMQNEMELGLCGIYRDIEGNPKRTETTILLGNVSGLLERSAPSFLAHQR